MPKNSVQIINPEALTDHLNALVEAAGESALRQAAVAGARVILDEVKLRVPRATGAAANELIIAYDKETSVPGKIASYLVTWSKKAYYLRFVEFGTSKAAAHPFLRPGFESKKKAAAEAVALSIQSQLKGSTNGK